MLDQALEGAGVYDPLVLPVEVRAEDEESAVTRLVATLSNELSEVAFNRVGLAVGQRRSGVRVVALLARRQVELDPRPGWLPPGATWQLRGRLIGEARSARVLVLRPGGRIEEIPTHVAGGRLAADVPVLKRGPHRIEVAVEEASGRPGLPAALVSVWCGRGPILAGGPSAKAAGVPRFSVLPADPVPTKKGGAVSRMRTWADDLRNEQGLPALSRDSKLDDVARRHAEYLARSRSLGHVDAKGRDPMRRLKRRGVVAKAAGENVAAGLSVEGIQSSLAKSPSHLREILRSDVRRTGLGLAERDGVLFFVQVFAGP